MTIRRRHLPHWRQGHVHENYNADTGEGCDKSASSDALYHWGGLLGFMALIEEGFYMHTPFCRHAHGAPEEFAAEAARKGLADVA